MSESPGNSLPEVKRKSNKEKTFNELLAETAQDRKESLILGIIEQAKAGEPQAIKMISTAILESQYSESAEFPLNDDQYKQIITMAARRLAGDFDPASPATAEDLTARLGVS